MPFLIDTDTIVFSMRHQGAVLEQFKNHRNDLKAISVITYGELVFGAYRSAHTTRNMATVRSIGELLPKIKASLMMRSRQLDDMDLMIAATALTGNYTLITNNERHFSVIDGLRTENWLHA
jgi:tRNA(fMet)-specific endonuclease VapC